MFNLNQDLYSIIFMILICIVGFLFFIDKNKMTLFSQSIYKTDYHSLYINRNLQFTIFRFLFIIYTIISISLWISLILKNENFKLYIIILILVSTSVLIRIIIGVIIGYLTNRKAISKKLLLIIIDVECLICILFFLILFILTYIPYNIFNLLHITFIIFSASIMFGKYILIKKFNHLKGLSFFNIILYLCVLDFIPLISVYKIFS